MIRLAKARASFTLGISTLAISVALTAASPAYAQTTSTLRGNVEGASAGTAVTATDTNTGQRATGRTDANGNYIIVGLRPGTYSVEVSGTDPRTVVVPVGQTVAANFAAASSEADIVVTGARGGGVSEVRTATIGTNVSQAQISLLPQNDRNFLNFAALAPGVQTSTSSTAKRIQAGAVTPDAVNVFIDGVSYKSQVGHGGVAGQDSSQGNPFPQVAIQEFRVETQNFKAEYEQAGSAIINAATKTGGTDFHGSAFVEFMPKSFFGRPYFDRPGNANNRDGTREKPDYQRWQYGGDFGGPIIKDLLHFYVAYEGTTQTNPSTAVNLPVGVPEAIRSAENGSVGTDFKQDLFFGKLTLFASARDTIDISGFERREQNLQDVGDRNTREHGRYGENNTRMILGSWRHSGDNWLNEAKFSYLKATMASPNVTDGPEIVLTPSAGNTDALASLGGHFFQQDSSQELYTFKNDSTFTMSEHTVKVGAKIALAKFNRFENWYTGGSYYYVASEYTGRESSTPWAARISTLPSTPTEADNWQVGLYVQDDWEIDDHWTVNAGLRWDYESNMFNNKYVTPAVIADALRNYQGWQAAGIDPENYISDGNERKPFYGAFQPRLGISYDVYGDRDLVFFVGAGRYYDRNVFLQAAIEEQVSVARSDVFLRFGQAGVPAFTPDLNDPEALRQVAQASSLRGNVWLMQDETKVPYSDMFNIGLRKQFGDIRTMIALSHVRSHNIFRYVRGNRMPDGSYSWCNVVRDEAGVATSFTPCGNNWVIDQFPPEGQLGFGTATPFSGKLNIGANNGKATYTAVYLTVDKPYTEESGYGFTFTATLSDPRTNVGTELINSDEFFSGPDMTQFGWQPVSSAERYRFVATGIVGLPWDITMSATGIFSSGPAFGTVIFPPGAPENACCIANLGGVFYPRELFAYSNVDVRLAKTFKLWGDHQVTVNAAAFNIFDTINRNYTSWGSGNAGNGTAKPPFQNDGDGTVGNARSFQVGLKYEF